MTSIDATYAPEMPPKRASAKRNATVSFASVLGDGEVISTVDSVTATPIGLTFSSLAANAAEETVNNKTVAVGKAAQFHVTGGTANTVYDITVRVTTDSTPAQEIPRGVLLPVVAG